jgi:hypothetical protein
MPNSMRDVSESLSIKITEFKMILGHINNKHKLLIIVEGNSDLKLFRKLFNSTTTIVKEVVGKSKILSAMDELLNLHNNIIAIKDSDFDKLTSNNTIKDNLFLTDYHDFEIEMFESKAFDSLISEYSQENCFQVHISNLRDKLYQIAIVIGYLRWFNEKVFLEESKYKLLFKGLKFYEFVRFNSCCLEFDKEVFFIKLIEHSKNKDNSLTLEIADLESKISELKDISTDHLQICCGHDLSELFAITVNKNQRDIESSLRLSYIFDYFKDTNLYKEITSWNEENYKYNLFN